jgi:hypothetical protein
MGLVSILIPIKYNMSTFTCFDKNNKNKKQKVRSDHSLSLLYCIR